MNSYVNQAGFYILVSGEPDRKGSPAEAKTLSDVDTKISYTDKTGKHIELPVT